MAQDLQTSHSRQSPFIGSAQWSMWRSPTIAIRGAVWLMVLCASGYVLQTLLISEGIAPSSNSLFLLNTLATSILALAVAIPLGICSALYLNLYASAKERRHLLFFHDQLARVPMVVWGWGGLYLASYWAIHSVQGRLFLASAILGLMVLPTFAILAEKSLGRLPPALRYSGLALGASEATIALKLLLPAAHRPLKGAILLALARVIGEVVIVSLLLHTTDVYGQEHDLQTLMSSLLTSLETVTTSQGLFIAGLLLFATSFCEFVGRRLLQVPGSHRP